MIKFANRILNKLEMFALNRRVFSLPRYLQIEPTNLCNQKCKMCPRNSHLDVPFGSMGIEKFKKILKEIPTIENLQLNGLGEPLMNEDIFEMIRFAKSKNIFVTVTSNCGLMTEDNAKKLINSGLDLLKISMDSLNPDIYRSIRNADPEVSYQGIKTFMRVRHESGMKNPSVWFNSIIMNDNYGDMVEILKFADELGVDLVRFKSVNVFDVYKDKNLRVEEEKIKNAVKNAINKADEFGLKIKHNLKNVLEKIEKRTYIRPKEKIPCYAPWSEVYIQHYGGVRLCCEFYSGKYDVGNMSKESFREIWNGKKMKHIREEFERGNTFFPVCKECNRFQRNVDIYNKVHKLRKFINLESS